MANIELVIKMPEEVYKQFRKDQKQKYVSAMISTDIIANGTPLPKGHGRLIDADELLKEHPKMDTYAFPSTAIESAPTIIEADKAKSEEV